MNAILSIKSIYATAIYQGIKTIEVRKTAIKHCDKIFLYETAPKRLITGYIQISQPLKVPIERIIQEYLQYTLLDEKGLRAYAGHKPFLYLWPIIHAERCEPLDIHYSAPQSYYYI